LEAVEVAIGVIVEVHQGAGGDEGFAPALAA
jgi:hypothetical protein